MAFKAVLEAEDAERKFKKAQKSLEAEDIHFEESLAEAIEKNMLTDTEAALVKRAHYARMDVIQVDEFEHDHWIKSVNNNSEVA